MPGRPVHNTKPASYTYKSYKPKAKDIVCLVTVTVEQMLKSETVFAEFLCHTRSGRTEKTRVPITLSPATRDDNIRFVGCGHNPSNGTVGDVVVKLNVDYGAFKVKGLMLSITKNISLLDTFTGTPIQVVLPNGETREVECPWQPGEPFGKSHTIISSQGLGQEGCARGHFKIDFRVITPKIPETRTALFIHALEVDNTRPSKRRKTLSP